MINPVNLFLLGAITMCLLIAAVFFLKFWKQTKDSLFLVFALSFLVESVNRAMLAFSANPHEGQPIFYMIRLVSFLIILFGILHKNIKK